MFLSSSSRLCVRAFSKRRFDACKVNDSLTKRMLSTTKVSDRDLQLEHTNMGRLMRKCWSLVVDNKEREKYYSLQKRGILPSDGFWSPVWVYLCLENPLLERYGISGSDLLEGSRYGYEVVNQALSTQDYYDFLRGDVDKSESHELLSAIQSPEVYKAWVESTKKFDDSGMRFKLTKLDIQKVTLRNVSTKIVPGDVPEGTEFLTDSERIYHAEASAMIDKFINRNDGEMKDKVSVTDVNNKSDTAKKTNVVKPLHSTTAPTSSTAPTEPITTPTPTATPTPSAEATAPTSTPTPTPTPTPAPTASVTTAPPVAPVAPAANAPVTAEGFKVQPATRRAGNAPTATRTGEESSATPGSATDPQRAAQAQAQKAEAEATSSPDQVISAEGTPVSVDTSSSTSTTTPTTTAEEAQESEEALDSYARDNKLFPPGSVIAYVDVQYLVHEESEITVPGEDLGPLKTITQAKVRDVLWSFRGCISGQAPLEWTLVDINGVRAQAFKA